MRAFVRHTAAVAASHEGFKEHPLFARLYIRGSADAEDRGQAEYRRELLDGIGGRVLELGCGNGLNFRHYPSSVDEVVAVEPEPTLREAAADAAARAPMPVRVVSGVADALPVDDASFDAAVACLVLCSVPDQASALAELRRVLRPGGELRVYEHVQAQSQPLAGFLKFAESTFWPRIGGGCHPARHTADAIAGAGFEVEECRRFGFKPAAFMPTLPHILGRARRP
jgi:ubiquinone/menaquinone biosynthesis C-methylase UbiE